MGRRAGPPRCRQGRWGAVASSLPTMVVLFPLCLNMGPCDAVRRRLQKSSLVEFSENPGGGQVCGVSRNGISCAFRDNDRPNGTRLAGWLGSRESRRWLLPACPPAGSLLCTSPLSDKRASGLKPDVNLAHETTTCGAGWSVGRTDARLADWRGLVLPAGAGVQAHARARRWLVAVLERLVATSNVQLTR